MERCDIWDLGHILPIRKNWLFSPSVSQNGTAHSANRNTWTDPTPSSFGDCGAFVWESSESDGRQVADKSGICLIFLREFAYPVPTFLAEILRISSGVLRDLFGKYPHLFGKRSGKGPFSSGKLLQLFGSCSAAAEAFLKDCRWNSGNIPD